MKFGREVIDSQRISTSDLTNKLLKGRWVSRLDIIYLVFMRFDRGAHVPYEHRREKSCGGAIPNTSGPGAETDLEGEAN